MKSPLFIQALVVALAVACASPAHGQRTRDLPGRVIDVATRQGVSDAVLRLVGTRVSAVTEDDGSFVLEEVPEGRWTLRVAHLAYGVHDHGITILPDQAMEVEIRLAAEAIELEPVIVETMTQRERAERGQGSSLHVVERPEIERAIGTSKHLGDLIVQTIPGVKMRQANNLAGTEVCLEFRGAASISLLQTRACSSPMVFLDGVPVSDPRYLYGTVGLQNIERIQLVPPGEAGARYGTGSLYGVILIDTRPPGGAFSDPRPRPAVPLPAPRLAFDWSQDPEGHDLLLTVAGAFLGNAIGLAAGIAVARQCIDIDDMD
jgi:outer membrane receptor for ferrienterochelin and colicins